jgi:hypothetical protein
MAGEVIDVPSKGVRSIVEALKKAQSGDTIRVASGIYQEHFVLSPGIMLQSEKTFAAVIDGKGRGTVVTLSNSNNISGFEIRNGTIGIYSGGHDNRISHCRIVNNIQAGILCVGHLPQIEDVIIAFNKGSGIKGWDVQSIKASLSHATIAYNENHGISLGGNSYVVVENCIIGFNTHSAIDIGVDPVRVDLNYSCLISEIPPVFPVLPSNLYADPRFRNPRTMDFTLQDSSRCRGAGSDKQDLGFRIVP